MTKPKISAQWNAGNTAGVEMKTGLSLQTAKRTNPCWNCTHRWDSLAWRRVPTSTQGKHTTSEQVEGQVVSSQSGSTSAAFNQTSYYPHISCDSTSWRKQVSCLHVMFCLSLCLQSLSRLVRVVPTLFLSVIDVWGPAAISEILVGAGATIQQHLLTVLAASLLSSCNYIQRFTQKVRGYSCLKTQMQMNIPYRHILMACCYLHYFNCKSLCSFTLHGLCLTAHKLICQELPL